MRASDAERERCAEVLREAVSEGRLTMEEFDQRLDSVYRARTRGELEPLTRDLPEASGRTATEAVAPARGGWAARIGRRASSRTGIAIMGGFSRRGPWTVPRRFRCLALMGGGDIDLREAWFEEREVVISAYAIMGGVSVTVPPGVEVEVRGVGIMGGFDQSNSGPGDPGAPRVVVTGLAFWGGVDVRSKPLPDKDKDKDKKTS